MRTAAVSWHGAQHNQCASCLHLRCLRCHPTPTIIQQQVTSLWPSSPMSLALLFVGSGQLAPPTLSSSDTPPSLLACSWEPAGGRVCLKVRLFSLAQGMLSTWAGKGRCGLGCAERGTWAFKGKHGEKGNVEIMTDTLNCSLCHLETTPHPNPQEGFLPMRLLSGQRILGAPLA